LLFKIIAFKRTIRKFLHMFSVHIEGIRHSPNVLSFSCQCRFNRLKRPGDLYRYILYSQMLALKNVPERLSDLVWMPWDNIFFFILASLAEVKTVPKFLVMAGSCSRMETYFTHTVLLSSVSTEINFVGISIGIPIEINFDCRRN
jgi:hypothetical protein